MIGVTVMKKPFVCYAVSRGRAIGVFDTWATCAASVRGFGPAARYRGFYSRADAEAWLLDERARLAIRSSDGKVAGACRPFLA